MTRAPLILAAGLLAAAMAPALAASDPLIVVEDRGGVSALPYYRALNPQNAPGKPPASMASPRIGGPADAEAAMLPVRSVWL